MKLARRGRTICTLALTAGLLLTSQSSAQVAADQPDSELGPWFLAYEHTVEKDLTETLEFVSSEKGWRLDQDFDGINRVRKTEDGGVTWQTQLTTSRDLLDLSFVDEGHGWAVGSTSLGRQGSVSITTDGGANWTDVQVPPPVAAAHYWITSVDFVDHDTGYATALASQRGFSDLRAFILRSDDGGYSWKEVFSGSTPPHNNAEFNDIAFVDEQTGWAVGGYWRPFGALIYHTADGGETWEEQSPPGVYGAYVAVSAVDQSTAWVAEPYEQVLRTTNGGKDWTSSSVASMTLHDIAFVDSTTGWALGSNVLIGVFRTDDGGVTWTNETPPLSNPCWQFCQPTSISVAGNRGYVSAYEQDLITRVFSTYLEDAVGLDATFAGQHVVVDETLVRGNIDVSRDGEHVKAITGEGVVPLTAGAGDLAVAFDILEVSPSIYEGWVRLTFLPTGQTVTLPADGSIVAPHGWTGAKGSIESETPAGPVTLRWRVDDSRR